MTRLLMITCAVVALSGCMASETAAPAEVATTVQTVGSIDMMQPGIVSDGAKVENLGGDFIWSEGPVWIADMDAVLFTDVPGNTIWKYKDGEGLTDWMSPSGAVPPIPDYTSSPGANGLVTFDAEHIVVPDHGNRTLWKMNVDTRERTPLATRYDGKRLNSPNDAVVHDAGIVFFTDPPFGLKGQDDSSAKELDFNGVFAVAPDGTMTVIDDTLSRPNGIALSPDQRTLYVANSKPEEAMWWAYDVALDGTVSNKRLLRDVTELRKTVEGNCDGMAIAADGTIFATGPGGVHVMRPDGTPLGLISTGSKIANVAFGGADGRDLYMTSHSFLARTRTDIKGLGF